MRLPFRVLVIAITTSALAFTPSAHADAVGTTVTGSLSFYDHYTGDPNAYLRNQNYFSSGSAVIGNGVEFTFLDGLGLDPLSAAITADFSGTTLSIFTEWSNFLDHRFVFTDPAFTGITYLGNSSSVHTSFNSGTITIDVLTLPYFCDCNGPFDPHLNRVDLFSLVPTSSGPVNPPPPPPSPSPVPEPGTLMLSGTGLLATVGSVRRRLQRA